MTDLLLMLTPGQLENGARVMAKHPRGTRCALRNGVQVTMPQLLTAARLLREAGPVICNGIHSDMSGWIDADRQDAERGILRFQVGILGQLFDIDAEGKVVAEQEAA